MIVKVKQVVKYGGHSIAASGVVNLTLKAEYSELTKSVELLQGLNNDIKIKAKGEKQPAMMLGVFRVKQTIFSGDGESIIKLSGITDNIEIENINKLITAGNENGDMLVMYEIEIDEEGDDDANE